MLVAELPPTGSYAPSFPECGYRLDLAATAIAIDGLGAATPEGNVYPFLAPAGLCGFSILAQFVVPSPFGSSGFLVTNDAHEITF